MIVKKDELVGSIPESAKRTLSRRTVLDWLGKATVLALGSDIIAACGAPGGLDPDGSSALDSGPDSDSPRWDGGLDASADAELDAPGEAGHDADVGADADLGGDSDLVDPTDPWAFRPPDEEPEIHETWPERTVDRQELESILNSWTLTIDGMVERSVTLNFAEVKFEYKQQSAKGGEEKPFQMGWDIAGNAKL